jgi:hypothetical protein
MSQGQEVVPRVSQALRPSVGEPLIVLFGPGASDEFVGTDYRERSLEEALWRVLRDAGYRNVVFTSASNPAYCLDDDSRRFIAGQLASLAPHRRRAAAGSGANAAAPDFAEINMKHPPTGALPVSGEPPSAISEAAEIPHDRASQVNTAPDGPRGNRALDAQALQLLHACQRIQGMPTAIVIVRAGEFLRFNGMERELADWFARWPHSRTAVDNVCVLVFTERSLGQTIEFVTSLGYVSALVDCLERQRARPMGRGGEIPEPDAAEIERILHLARLRDGLAIADWREFDRIVAALASRPDVPGYIWIRQLHRLARTGTALSEDEVRAQGWVESLPSGQSAWDRLTELTGLTQVKEHIDGLRWRAEAEAKRRREGLLRESGSLHLVFTGGPGTGKTTVARLIGELYREMGILRRGHLHAPEASDLIGMYVGHTAVQTNRAVDAALDGVLFIDEAYRLSEAPGGYGQEAIDTLITRMDNDRDRLVVIVAGYPDKMDAFLRSNPGLPRRFPRGNVIAFPDYDPDALFTILLRMLRDRGMPWVPELEPVLRRVVTGLHEAKEEAKDETFGNAGEMRNLAQELETNWARRTRAQTKEPVTPDDLPDSYGRYA